MKINTKKIIKILAIILVVMTIFAIVQPVMAVASPANITAGDVSSDAMDAFGSKIVGIIRAAGIIISVVMLMVLGIKYMMGSAEEKAEYKKSMMPYLVGAVLLFAASTIAGFIFDLITNTK